MTINQKIREYALNLPRIDTHAHIEADYAGLREAVQQYAALRNTADLIGSRILAAGCRELYGLDPGALLTPDAPEEIFAAAEKLRASGQAAAFEYALDQAGITRQLAFTGQIGFQSHQAENCPLRAFSPRISLLAYLDAYITGDDHAFTVAGQRENFCYYHSMCDHFGKLQRLDDYLDALDQRIDSWRSYGVIGMKLGIAYTIGLDISSPTLPDARNAFQYKEAMIAEDIRTVQHYALHHAFAACLRNNLPVIIHTGFLIWGNNDQRQANPALLHRVLSDPRYQQLNFILLHGGNPYVGEMSYLAGMLPNVYLDFTWISWINRTRFRSALAEWLEVVPHHKFMWGSDSGNPESIVGINAVVRREIAEVLDEQLQRGIIDEKGAEKFLRNCYQQTPASIFGLPQG